MSEKIAATFPIHLDGPTPIFDNGNVTLLDRHSDNESALERKVDTAVYTYPGCEAVFDKDTQSIGFTNWHREPEPELTIFERVFGSPRHRDWASKPPTLEKAYATLGKEGGWAVSHDAGRIDFDEASQTIHFSHADGTKITAKLVTDDSLEPRGHWEIEPEKFKDEFSFDRHRQAFVAEFKHKGGTAELLGEFKRDAPLKIDAENGFVVRYEKNDLQLTQTVVRVGDAKFNKVNVVMSGREFDSNLNLNGNGELTMTMFQHFPCIPEHVCEDVNPITLAAEPTGPMNLSFHKNFELGSAYAVDQNFDYQIVK